MSTLEPTKEEQNKLAAAIDFLRRTGLKTLQIRVSDEEEPHVWIVIAEYENETTVVQAALSPLRAATRLCEQVADGGICAHCNRSSGFEPDLLLRMPADDKICWYQYDPELKTYRRGCE